MKITSAEFVISAVKESQFPKDGLPEIALIGRSNVGKSSLINTLLNRKSLAKTSSQPGKTRTINFYRINKLFYFVDLPGFGYAKVPMEVKKTWESMIGDYLEQREGLKGAFIILDARRDAGDMEEKLYEWAQGLSIPFVTVFTKSDKLSKNQLASRMAAFKRELNLIDPVAFSAVTGEGKLKLLKKLEEMIGTAPAHPCLLR